MKETLYFEEGTSISEAEGYLLQLIKERKEMNLCFLNFVYYIMETGYLMHPDDPVDCIEDNYTIVMLPLQFS